MQPLLDAYQRCPCTLCCLRVCRAYARLIGEPLAQLETPTDDVLSYAELDAFLRLLNQVLAWCCKAVVSRPNPYYALESVYLLKAKHNKELTSPNLNQEMREASRMDRLRVTNGQSLTRGREYVVDLVNQAYQAKIKVLNAIKQELLVELDDEPALEGEVLT